MVIGIRHRPLLFFIDLLKIAH